MITTIFNTIGEAINGFFSNLESAFSSIGDLFFDGDSGTMTFLGTLLLIAAGIGLVYFAFRMIYRLVRKA